MALAMPSRFACLKIEGEDVNSSSTKPISGGNNGNNNNNKNKKPDAKPSQQQPKSGAKTGDKGSKRTVSKTTSVAQKKDKKGGKKEQTQQWEEWKQRDEDLVDGYFEKDLQSAIMLSKLDFEHTKTLSKTQHVIKTDCESAAQQKRKQQKNKTMSLEQFNVLVSGGNSKSSTSTNSSSNNNKTDSLENRNEHFFETVDEDAKRELNRDQNIEKRKKREANIEDIITLAQCQEKLRVQAKENESLRDELEKAKQEILTVKTRNKTLCSILGHGEMKDKADVLMELERLGHVKDELTEEVTRLHGLLEQERSKVAALTSEQHKQKEKAARKKHGV